MQSSIDLSLSVGDEYYNAAITPNWDSDTQHKRSDSVMRVSQNLTTNQLHRARPSPVDLSTSRAHAIAAQSIEYISSLRLTATSSTASI
jgi:hypothetical protein